MKNTYNCTFYGRKLNACGITYLITYTVQADNAEDARLELYKHFEHISYLNIIGV